MRCKSCKEDVPPKFTHALSVNICPLCGQEIMEIKLQNILGELKIALCDAKEYMDEVEDWLHSNFSLKKVGSNQIIVDKNYYDDLVSKRSAPQPNLNQSQPSGIMQQVGTAQNFKQPPHTPGKGISVHRSDDGEDEAEDVVVDEQSIFAKRAGVPNHRKAVDFIKGRPAIGAAAPSEFQGIDDEYGDMNLDSEAGSATLSSNERKQMASLFQEDDLGKSSHELEMQKLKRLQAQSSVGDGGGSGFFRRA